MESAWVAGQPLAPGSHTTRRARADFASACDGGVGSSGTAPWMRTSLGPTLGSPVRAISSGRASGVVAGPPTEEAAPELETGTAEEAGHEATKLLR